MKDENKAAKYSYLILFARLLIDFIIIFFIVADYFKLSFMDMLFIFILLQAFYLIVWIKNSIINWGLFSLFGKKIIIEQLGVFLKENKFPKSGEKVHSTPDYFFNIINDEQASVELRLKSAIEYGTINSYLSQYQYQKYMMINSAYKDAICNYSR